MSCNVHIFINSGDGRPPPTTAPSSKLPRILLLSALALFSISFLYLRSLHPTAAPSLSNARSSSPSLVASEVYHSLLAFAAGYAEMERSCKVFIYHDGDLGTFYQTLRKLIGKYASEGYFFQNIRKSRFRTNDPNRTHLFFVPPPQDAWQVTLSDYYDLPFGDILDWRKFAVVLESDVYQLKSILKSKSQEEFVALHKSLVQVQKHFEWHSPPVPYDAFHIVVYELWLRHHVIKY